MSVAARIASLARNLFRRERVERELDLEVRTYAEMLAADKIGAGMNGVEARREALLELGGVEQVKDTLRALVRIGFDGRVYKTFRGPKAEERFANEVKVLKHLEARGCTFVPRLLESDPAQLRIVTTNCGGRVEHQDGALQDRQVA